MKGPNKKKQQDWLKNGHGKFTPLVDEKEFFEVTKKSVDIVCLFYNVGDKRCKIVDRHLKILAPQHPEAKFCKVETKKAPFLTQRLLIKELPTLLLVKDGMVKDFIIGFAELGNTENFSTKEMESRIALSETIQCQENQKNPANVANGIAKTTTKRAKKTKRVG
ncbi:thioredoxin domain-containing protein 9-like [Drosophila eugracilis]|uniref:thioredoxin domain-containing protein 9-like n=1 Tax=Drosophila eugracilis TaxID=29029 RepID=UPI001BDA7E99|nr:thioredoxin domain-containing protein 9-like [Drosophila eugracilis]